MTLAEVDALRVEAEALLRSVAAGNPTSDVEVIREFADVARLRELAQRLLWYSEVRAELRQFYVLRGEQVRAIIAKGVAAR